LTKVSKVASLLTKNGSIVYLSKGSASYSATELSLLSSS